MGRVVLVGAGPGDAGLITVKGLEQLKKCDAVVYDRLAAEELLEAVPPGCEKIYVGKEAGRHSKSQREINDILVHCAEKYGIVVRLKGGDPFVFGRGGEEIEALLKHNIPYEVIPGVSSAVAVPECAGIPVTHRGIARSVHIITGHTQDSEKEPAYDYELLGKLEGTLVFLMGLSNLGEIAANLIRAGKPANTPSAVISQGTTCAQKTVRGRLDTIAQRVKERKLSSPGIIVIGETAKYEYRYRPMEDKWIGITATRALWEKLSAGAQARGMKPVSLCRMQVVPTDQLQRLGRQLHDLAPYQWVLFTSQNAVQLFFQEMLRQQLDIRSLGSLKVGALGSKTAEKLLEYGIRADFIPSVYEAAVFGEEFIKIVKEKEKVLIPRSVQGSRELTDILMRANVDYLELAIYDVAGRMTGSVQYMENLAYLVFVSASGVDAFFDGLQERGLSLPEGVRIACIGRITKKRLEERGQKADVTSVSGDVEDLLEKIERSGR